MLKIFQPYNFPSWKVPPGRRIAFIDVLRTTRHDDLTSWTQMASKAGTPKSSKALILFLVLKPMVTWASPILGNLQIIPIWWPVTISIDPDTGYRSWNGVSWWILEISRGVRRFFGTRIAQVFSRRQILSLSRWTRLEWYHQWITWWCC